MEVRVVSAEELRQAQTGINGRVPVEQAEAWVRFSETSGSPLVDRVMWFEDDKPVAMATFYEHQIRGIKYLWSRRGPVWLRQPSPEREAEALQALKAHVSRAYPSVAFIRLHSWFAHPFLEEPLRVIGFDRTAVIDGARGNRDQALERMPSVGRKLVRRAQKLFGDAGGVITEETGLTREQFSEFYRLLEETSKRDGFTPHEEKYYWDLLEQLGPQHARLFSARVNGELACWDLVVQNGKNIGALFGASSPLSRETRAAVLLDFEVAVRLAAEGTEGLDLMGVYSPRVPSLYDVGRYKLQFAQNYTDVAGLWDMPVHAAVCAGLRAAYRGRAVMRRLTRKPTED